MTSEWFDDAFGPDGIRVTVCIEPAAERVVREAKSWGFLQPKIFDPAGNAFRHALPGFLESRLFKDRWAVLVEADSGQRVRLIRNSKQEALAAGENVRKSVMRDGVKVLPELR